MIVDESLLPPNALIDTGVFFRGVLGDRPEEEKSRACVAFCAAMLANGNTLFVAAPTLAEVCRYNARRVPHRRGIVVVPFDDQAAEKLALAMPMEKISEAKNATGFSKTYLKYDSLIGACALRAKAVMIVALDTDHVEMATSIGLKVMHPKDFEKRADAETPPMEPESPPERPESEPVEPRPDAKGEMPAETSTGQLTMAALFARSKDQADVGKQGESAEGGASEGNEQHVNVPATSPTTQMAADAAEAMPAPPNVSELDAKSEGQTISASASPNTTQPPPADS